LILGGVVVGKQGRKLRIQAQALEHL